MPMYRILFGYCCLALIHITALTMWLMALFVTYCSVLVNPKRSLRGDPSFFQAQSELRFSNFDKQPVDRSRTIPGPRLGHGIIDTMRMQTIDGAMGEGGGQILRSSLALSLCLEVPFRIFNIRALRDRPGLMHQHLAAVAAAKQISDARVTGAVIGSRELTFVPQQITPGTYRFDIGTAGSVTLVLQTVLPALISANARSELVLEGGTHNPFAPPFDFLALAYLPLIKCLGPCVEATLDRPGFYPAGGGLMRVSIRPAEQLHGLDLLERGEILQKYAHALLANLPEHIGHRELKTIGKMLKLKSSELVLDRSASAKGPGNVVMVVVKSQSVTEVFTGFGQRGIRAETVAEKVVKEVDRYLRAEVAVGHHLADQLLVPLALAGRGSFVTLKPSSHALTNIEVIKKFVDISVCCTEIGDDIWSISLR